MKSKIYYNLIKSTIIASCICLCGKYMPCYADTANGNADRMANESRQTVSELMDQLNKYRSSGLDKEAYATGNRLMEYKDFLTRKEYCLTIASISKGAILLGDHDQAIQYIKELRDLSRNDGLILYDVIADDLQARVMLRYGLLENAGLNIQEGFKKINAVKSRQMADSLRMILYTTSSLVKLKQGDIPGALKANAKATTMANDVGSRLDLDLQKAEIMSNTHDGEEEIILSGILGQNTRHKAQGMALSRYVAKLVDAGRNAEAINMYEAHKNMEKLILDDPMSSRLHQSLSEAYVAIGDIESGLKELSRSKEIADSLIKSDNALLADSFYSQYLRRKKLADDQEMSLFYSHRVWTFIILLAVVVIFLVGISVLLLYYRNHKNKVEKALECFQADKAEKESNLQKSYLASDNQLHELSSLSLQLAHENTTINNVIKALDDSQTDDAEKLSKVKNALVKIDLKKEIWNLFTFHFNRTNRAFMDELLASHPDLTKGEIRLCILISMNLSTKEMANLTNRSIRTIESMKYRLHKKLNITESTETYLRQFNPGSSC